MEIAEKHSQISEFNADQVTQEFAAQLRNPLPLGDIVESLAKRLGADKIAAWYEKWSGKSCGCNSRKQWLNAAGLWLVGKGP